MSATHRSRHAVITGGAGFIGSHLSRRLASQGARVTVLTRQHAGPRARALASQGVTVVPFDAALPQAPPVGHITGATVLFHLAADVSVAGPKVWSTNVDGTQRVLDLADALNIPFVVFASSIEAQGLTSDHDAPLSETAPCRPVSEYGSSKGAAEKLVDAWGSRTGRRALIVRIGNIYGPGSPWLVQSSIMAMLGAGSVYPVWRELRSRQFQPLYIDDVIDGMLRMVDRELTGLYNLTGEEPVTIETYLEQLAGLIDLRPQLAQALSATEYRQPIAPDFAYFLLGDSAQRHRLYDNAKVRAEIGPYGRWPLRRGLASTLRWYHDCGQLGAVLASIRHREGSPCASH